MRLAVADTPSPVLAEPRVIASGTNGAWHDFFAALRHAGIQDTPATEDLPHALALLAAIPQASRRRIEHVLDARKDGIAAPMLLKPLAPLAKILLTEGSLAL